MNNALLINASRQIALARELDIVANNVANIGTTGFKRRSPGFSEHLMPVARADAQTSADKRLSFVASRGNPLDLSAGAVERTGNPLDVAIRGDAFLAVQTPQGERYTRSGSMALSASGDLVTLEGHPVLTDSGPITLSAQEGPASIGPDGTISTAQGARGKLKLVRFEHPHMLESLGANLLAASEAPQPAGTQARVEPGALERSNVSSVTEVARLVEVSRAYSGLAQMVQRTDELRRSTISRLAEAN